MTGTRNRALESSFEREGVSEGAPPGWFDAAAAQWRADDDDTPERTIANRKSGWRDVEDALGDLGFERSTKTRLDPLWGWAGVRVDDDDARFRAIWNNLEAARQRDPKLFADLPKTFEQADQYFAGRKGGTARDQAIAARGGFGSTIVPGLARGLRDLGQPENLIAGAAAVGRGGLNMIAVREAGINVAIEAGNTANIASARGRRGEGLSGDEVLANAGVAAVLGGAMPYVAAGLKAGAPRVATPIKGAQERALAAIIPHLPEALRPRIRTVDDIPDGVLADTIERLVGRDNLSEHEAFAVRALRDQAAFDAINPYVPDAAGIAAHKSQYAEAMRIISSARTGPVRPRPQFQAGTALAPARVAVAGYDPTSLKAAIRGPESGGNDAAVNRMGSSASGRYQFIESTFKSYYARVFGGDAKAAWRNRRFDPQVQEALMDALMADNAATLRRNGIPVDNGSMYAMHVLGNGNGPKLLRADPSRPVSDFLSASIIRQNPSYFGNGRTVGQALDQIARRVGGRGGASERFAARTANDLTALDVEQMRRDMQRVALEADTPDTRFRGPDVVSLADEADLPSLPRLRPELAEPSPVPDYGGVKLSDEQAAILPALRMVVRDSSQSLNSLPALAHELGISETDLKAGLTALSGNRELRLTKAGHFRRIPREDGPVDMLTYIARNGGIRDDEGHRLGLTGTSNRERREMVRAAQDDALRKRRGGGRDFQRFIPGAGPLLRHDGNSIDDLGQLLTGAGYFDELAGDRPSVDMILDRLESAVQQGQKFYPTGQIAERKQFRDALFQDGEHEAQVMASLAEGEAGLGFALDPEMRDRVVARLASDPFGDAEAAILREINNEIESLRVAAYHELKSEAFDEIDDDIARARQALGFDPPEDVGGSAPFSRDAGEGGAASGRGDGSDSKALEALEPQWLDAEMERAIGPSENALFDGLDDPFSPQSRAMIDGMMHDLKMLVTLDPEARFMLDESGDARNIADIMDELDITKNEIDAMRACMIPKEGA